MVQSLPAGKSGFVSYARLDGVLVGRFLRSFGPVAAAGGAFALSAWHDRRILPGELWLDSIFAAIGGAEVHLAMVSPAFLSSEFIATQELPRMLASGKPVIPVLLKPVDFVRMDLRGLAPYQFFALPLSPETEIAFADCVGRAQQERFALELMRRVWDVLASPGPVPDAREAT